VDLRVATGLLRSIDAVDGSSSFESVKGAVAARARLVAMLDGEGARLAKLLERHTPRADKAFGEAARKSEREGRKMRQRAETVDEAPPFGSALAAGDVSGDHVDLFGAALRGPTTRSGKRSLRGRVSSSRRPSRRPLTSSLDAYVMSCDESMATTAPRSSLGRGRRHVCGTGPIP
jgi:hypothetical protein